MKFAAGTLLTLQDNQLAAAPPLSWANVRNTRPRNSAETIGFTFARFGIASKVFLYYEIKKIEILIRRIAMYIVSAFN